MEEKNSLYKISKFIVDKRKAFYLIFSVAVILSLIFMLKVRVNTDIASYLPSDTETKIGLDIMDREFVTYPSTDVMVSNITYNKAEEIKEMIENSDGVKGVTFDNDNEHYKNSAALFEVTLDCSDDDLDRELEIINNLKEQLKSYDSYFYSDSIDDSSVVLENEMNIILLIAIIIIILVLLITSQSFMEVPVFLITFIAAAALNMGTNYFLGEISFITKSIAVALQLALAIDYSIILSHRFAEEKLTKNNNDAIASALSKAIIEISSSSLTTVSGLAALILMQLKIGMDMGLVLCKGIIFSLLAVFLLMPGLLLMFSDLIDKTKHKSYIPSIRVWCGFVVKLRYVVPVIFVIIIAACAVFSSKAPFSFYNSPGAATRPTEKSIAMEKIFDTFGEKHTLAVILPIGQYENEKKLIDEVEKLPGIVEVQALASTEIKDGHTLTEKITPREFADLMEIDYSACKLLFQAYGIKNEEYNALLGDVSEYQARPIDIILFLEDYMDNGVITLDEQDEEDLHDLFDQLKDARQQLEGENYSRIVFKYSTAVESDDSYKLLDKIHEIAGKYYSDVVISSNTTNAKELKESFAGDNRKISLITILAVMAILLFTFKSSVLPVLLVLAIQGSIWINFSFPYFSGKPLYFLGYLVVSSIQMGATIDYAIVFTNRYLELRSESSDIKEAAKAALDQSFPTIITSGSILTIVGLIIGKVSTNPIISSLGTCLGQGTFISIIIVMLVLPQIIILSDKIIANSFFKKEAAKGENSAKQEKNGTMLVNGKIQGYVNGYVYGSFHGIVMGNVKAEVELGDDKALLTEGDSAEWKKIKEAVQDNF